MMNLAEYRRRSQSLADYLPWAALVYQGVVLNKDGSFQRTARFRGPDLDSATPAELVATTIPHHCWPSAPDSDQKKAALTDQNERRWTPVAHFLPYPFGKLNRSEWLRVVILPRCRQILEGPAVAGGDP